MNSDVTLVYLLSEELIFGIVVCLVANLSSYLYFWFGLFFGQLFMYIWLIYLSLRLYCDIF